jgi:MTH538 TIR-like domain (DUF1863)
VIKLLCVGEETYKSDWCNWEIDKAEELGLNFAAVKISNSNPFLRACTVREPNGLGVLLKLQLRMF